MATGKVLFPDGEPVPFANVFSLDRSNFGGYTNEHGVWSHNFTPGERVRVSHVAIHPWDGVPPAVLYVQDKTQNLPPFVVHPEPRSVGWLFWVLLAYALSDD